MNIKKSMALGFILSVTTLSAQTDFSTLWKDAEKLEKQALPQSALAIVDQIYAGARKEGNTPELIKSLVHKLKYETAIDRDRLQDNIRDMEMLTRESKDSVEQSILYSLLAELYNNYYQSNLFRINQRMAIVAEEGAEAKYGIREWPANFFIRTITGYVNLSLLPAEELQNVKTLDYQGILTAGEASRRLRPTLYDFLAHRGIEIMKSLANNSRTQNYFPQTRLWGKENFAPAEEFVRVPVTPETYDFVPRILRLYQDLLAFHLHRQVGDEPLFALMMLDLERLEFVWSKTSSGHADMAYLDALQQLKKQYAAHDFCAEVFHNEALYYSASPFLYDAEEDTANANAKRIYELCMEGIEKYPRYKRTGLLKNMLSEITQGNLEVYTKNTVYPGENLELSIRYRNLRQITVEVYQIHAPASIYSSVQKQYLRHGVLLNTGKVDLISPYPYLYSDTVLKLPVRGFGNYEYIVYSDSGKKESVNGQFSVSRLATVSKAVAGKREFLVVDRQSGKPVEGAQIHFYKRKNNLLESVESETSVTDKLGLATANNNQEVTFYRIVSGSDTALIPSPVPWVSSYLPSSEPHRILSLFTDRSIYRPGQTVYFKGIAYIMGGNAPEVIAREPYTLALHDANGEEIASKTFTTNELGSIAGEFVLPQGLLNGNFSIQSKNNTYYSFRVEEYKRPSFDIVFEPNESAFRLGDTVTVKGKAKTFSGVNLQAATLRYRVTRKNHRLFSWRWQSSQQVAEGKVQTGDDGSFEIVFAAPKAPEDKNRDMTYTFTVEATVTDSNGETQTGQTAIHAGNKSILLNLEGLTETVDKDRLPTLKVMALNANGNLVAAQGTYRIYSLKTALKDKFDWKADDWTPDKLLHSGDFEAGKEMDISSLKSLPSGRYRINLSPDATEDGETVDFTLSSVNDRQPPVPLYEWLMTPQTTCAPGETAQIIYGSSAKNIHVLYEIFRNSEKLSARRFVLNNENRKIEIPFLPSYGDGITVAFTFIKDNRLFTRNVNIYRKQPNRELNLKLEVFRDRLLPGQQEEWKISVKDDQAAPVAAELLAGMYDASLDKLNPHAWSFNPVKPVWLSAPRSNGGNEFESSSARLEIPLKDTSVPALRFDAFNWFGWKISNEATVVVVEAGDAIVGSTNYRSSVAELKADNAFSASRAVARAVQQESHPVQIRQNFNETAFFYPQLKTDAGGETLLSFTVPESNTTWKLMGLAHTKDLKYGQIIAQAIARKQLMIAPNIPRFFREGDRTTVASKISNLSDKPVSGTVSIECFDPETNRPAITVAGSSKEFTVEAGRSTDVSWTFDVPSGIDLTALKIVVRSAAFSDGEQHLIPVLPNRILVTESLPLNIRGGQTKTFTFDVIEKNTSSTQENYRLTLEFADNPTWYAVQALPALTAPESDNVLSWFAAYYANTLAVQIAGSSPAIQPIIDAWSKQGKETLRSKLEKEQELKTVLLEETPWVLEAQNETEQKQRLVHLFDKNRSFYLNRQAIEKLQSFQLTDGGWAWFKGMNASVDITQWILYGLGDIGQGKEISEMQVKAVHFIDRRFKQHFENFKEHNPAWEKAKTVSTYELEYLLVRSLYKNIPLEETKEPVQFYTALAGKYWADIPSIYGRAIAAIVLQRNGDAKTARFIVQSLREHATRKPDLGMFWANNTAQAFFFQSAVSIHTFLMEAFRATGAKPEEMDEMKLWLLKQKQTQRWENTPATVSAIRMLLQTGTDWLANEGKTAIHWGTQLVTQPGEAGTGYIKAVYDAPSITPDMSQVKITKEDASPGWGALYRQYFEDLDKVTSAKTELNVSKSLFIESITPAGKILLPVTEEHPLQVGDKVVVRLTVHSGRDMEYVHLKDMRASCFESAEQLSGIRWTQSTVYYQSTGDASANFYFYNLPKGVYVFEYPLYVNSAGDYSNGITTIQCLYAPEFVSHTAGRRVRTGDRNYTARGINCKQDLNL
jgi:uncharacterized protein YfaS (alpha-2-macroglobulin family)